MENLNVVLLYVILLAIIYLLPLLGDYLYKKDKERYKRNIIYNEKNKDLKFEEIYSKINNENISRIEEIVNARKKEVLKNVSFLIAFLMLIILNINFDTLFKGIPVQLAVQFNLITVGSLYMCPILWCVNFTKRIYNNPKEYQKQYKETIMADFINLYNNDYIYKLDIEDQEHLKLRDEYYENKFLIGKEGKIDLLNVQSCIYGKIDNATQMSLYDISVEIVDVEPYSYIVEGKYSEFKQKYEGTSVFKGTYIIIDIDRKIPTFVRIIPNKYVQRKNEVELDSNEFEKYFDVNSENKILAVRILTADVMQMLVDFYKKYNIKFEVLFRENKIYINLHTTEAFAIPIYTGINKKKIYLYYAILEFTTNLSKEINRALNGIEL